MAVSIVSSVQIVVTNAKALRGLLEALEILEDEADDSPWNETVRRALVRLRYAVRHLDLVPGGRDDPAQIDQRRNGGSAMNLHPSEN